LAALSARSDYAAAVPKHLKRDHPDIAEAFALANIRQSAPQ
jgi:hypothetical protein